ncbi:uncharacterized mitochondrial protein AtMg00810-like [Phragmites australis]|uniref:uncharacterized mitochondrial protein AtMg00810-like n=1 Tax=Phragmites australis TaxID=29695 RepID=UPI002D7894BC|nr:uncharacterized mitochondrial protein AtMg00810-like [Phragmites australis]
MKIGFAATRFDASLFVLKRGSTKPLLLLYVDDIVLTASDGTLLHDIIQQLHDTFTIKDLGQLHYFLGIKVRCTSAGSFLSQQKYAEEDLKRAGMTTCKAVSTPVGTSFKLVVDGGRPIDDQSDYRSLTGALQYLTLTRSDLAYAVQQIHVSPSLDVCAYSDADWARCPDT